MVVWVKYMVLPSGDQPMELGMVRFVLRSPTLLPRSKRNSAPFCVQRQFFLMNRLESNPERGRITFGLGITGGEVRHGPQPKPSVGVGGTVVTPDPLAVGIAGLLKLGHVLVLARLPVQNGNALLDANEDLLPRVDTLDVRRDRHGFREGLSAERAGAVREGDGVQLLVDDVDEAERVGGLLEERALTELAVDVEPWLACLPGLKVFRRHYEACSGGGYKFYSWLGSVRTVGVRKCC